MTLFFFFFGRSSGPVPKPDPAYTLAASQRQSAIGHVDAPGFFPPQTVETLNFAFDMDIMLADSEQITDVTWGCAVIFGVDANAAERINGAAVQYGSVTVQNVGPGVSGVTYRFTATVQTSASQSIVIYANCLVQ